MTTIVKSWIADAARFRWPALVFAVGLLAFCVAGYISAYCPHVPLVHDEFSYILSAETLLHGRLANPTPDVWQPLQSFHVVMSPSYASKYPLGSGLVIALGCLLVGLPIAGSWIAAGMCSSSICWMLAGATNRKWAVLGGCLTALHPAMQTSWSQSLVSGWLTATGSALLMGAVLRLRRRVEIRNSVVVGIGVAVLALTRPFEGLVCTLLSAAVLWQLWGLRTIGDKTLKAMKVSAWAVAPVAIALFLTAAQNLATTGKITVMPYQLHEHDYGVAPLFVFDEVKSPAVPEEDLPQTIRDYHEGWSLQSYLNRVGLWGWLIGVAQSLHVFWSYWGITFCVLPLATRLWSKELRLGRLLLAALCLQVFASSLVCWVFPHYLSPVLPWLAILGVVGLRHWLHGLSERIGQAQFSLQRNAVVVVVALQLVMLAATAYRLPNAKKRQWGLDRESVIEELSSEPGNHLVLVHYGPDHSVHEEWVYNSADLNGSRIIWARGEREDWNQRLYECYGDSRKFWHLYPDRGQSSLTSVAWTPSAK